MNATRGCLRCGKPAERLRCPRCIRRAEAARSRARFLPLTEREPYRDHDHARYLRLVAEALEAMDAEEVAHA